MSAQRDRREVSAWVLLAAQVAHGLTPADTEAEGVAGAIGGLILLIATMATILGLRTSRWWAPKLGVATGLAVAVGFVLYHSLPFRSAVTNPYPGEPVGPFAWIGVAVAVASGVWVAVEHRRSPATPDPMAAPPPA